MKAEKVVKTLLDAAAGVTALVSTRIYGGQLPQDPTLPALVYESVSEVPLPPITALAGGEIQVARIQVTAFAADYPGVKALLDAVRAALSYQSGTIAGAVVLSVLPDVQGPDLYDDVLLVPYQSRDFLIKHYQ